MTPKFKVKYEETKETLIQTCELYRLDLNKIGYRICTICLGIAVLIIILVKSNILTLSIGEQISFYLKYAGIWIAIFLGMEIFRRTLGKKMANTSAYGDGDAAYAQRVEQRKGKLIVEMSFFDDGFLNDTQTKQSKYSYSEVCKILESDSAIGIVIKTAQGAKGIYSFPKNSLLEGSLEELKDFLVSHCDSVNKVTTF